MSARRSGRRSFVRDSPLADKAGWIEVDPATLQHPRFGNVFGRRRCLLGAECEDGGGRTKAGAGRGRELSRCVLDGQAPRAVYDGYGSCPLTVERGKIVLAEFGYGGKILPTFPFLDGSASRAAWRGS